MEKKLILPSLSWGFPRWHNGKEPTCQCNRCGFDPWVWNIPWSRQWPLSPAFLPGKSLGQRSVTATVHGVAESDTTARTHPFLTPFLVLCSSLLKHISQTIIVYAFVCLVSLSQSKVYSVITRMMFNMFCNIKPSIAPCLFDKWMNERSAFPVIGTNLGRKVYEVWPPRLVSSGERELQCGVCAGRYPHGLVLMPVATVYQLSLWLLGKAPRKATFNLGF